MHAALGRRDVVRERVDPLVVPGVPLHRDVDVVVLAGVLERHDPLEQRLLRGVEVPDEVGDAPRELEVLGHHGGDALVAEADLETLVEERHLAQALDQGLGPELGLLEDGGVGPEGDDGPGPSDGALLLELALNLAAVREVEEVLRAVAMDLEVEPGRQRVDHGHAHAVESAGDLVALPAELAAGVEDGQDHLSRRLAPVLRVRIDRDPAPVVEDPTRAVGQEGDVDAGRVPRHRLVDGVVDDFVDQVVESGETGAPDVHPGAFTDRFEAFENRDVLGAVRHALPPLGRRGNQAVIPGPASSARPRVRNRKTPGQSPK